MLTISCLLERKADADNGWAERQLQVGVENFALSDDDLRSHLEDFRKDPRAGTKIPWLDTLCRALYLVDEKDAARKFAFVLQSQLKDLVIERSGSEVSKN